MAAEDQISVAPGTDLAQRDLDDVGAIHIVPNSPNSPTAHPPSAPAVMQPVSGGPHVHYTLAVDTNVGSGGPPATQSSPARGVTRSETDLSRFGGVSPMMRRHDSRANAFKTVEDFEEFEFRPGWQPGAEPGVDPSKADGGHASIPTLWAPCEITVVDFAQSEMVMQKLDNDTIVPFLKNPPPAWAKCRWINVNGLSWDVIRVLGQYKKLHKLAIEDVMNTRSRTKADWFPSHAFVVLTLQKLVHLVPPKDNSPDDGDDGSSVHTDRGTRSNRSHGISKGLRNMFSRTRDNKHSEGSVENGTPDDEKGNAVTRLKNAAGPFFPRTLQRYHASPNDARTEYMEKHSALTSRNLVVAAEQVSIFITNDNTIISFFELSAQDVERPILQRLGNRDTILRQSCDASMVGQAIIDAIIDLAIPVAACYGDVIGDLELDVLTRPNIGHTKSLYVIISEINKVLSFVHPISNLINAMRDHKTLLSQDAALRELQDPTKGVIITPMTYTYLGDVLDHCVLISEALSNLKASADGMIGLIFNTISNFQNESMRQLSIVTVIFLPMTFLSGYFGQNFQPFVQLQNGIGYFWEIATPMVVLVILVLMREMIWDYFRSLVQRRHIFRLRKNRRREMAKKRV